MASSDKHSERTNPVGNDEDSDEEEFNPRNAVPEDFRGKVRPYSSSAQYPSAPLYEIGEEVYLRIPGRTQPLGPFLVIEILENQRYRLKSKATNLEYGSLVKEDDLLVRV